MGLERIHPDRAYEIRSQAGKAASKASRERQRRYCNKGHELTEQTSRIERRLKLNSKNGKYYEHTDIVCKACHNLKQNKWRLAKRRQRHDTI